MKKITPTHDEFMDLLVGLSQAARCCRQDTAFCEGVTFQQFVILDAVVKSKELNVSDLHGILAVEKSTTTRLVKPLIQKGLLTQRKSRLDSRAFVLTLTKEGKNIHQNVQSCLKEFFNKVACNLPPEKKDDILQTLQIFINAIKNAAGVCDCCK
ncbi:MAG: MarR family winged helix-turn-helix transcriptional regulator [Smithellaceae bacterium]